MFTEQKVCLSVNVAQSASLEKESIELNNYFKQMLVPFKIYADYECNLESVKSYEGSYSKKFKIALLAVFLTSLFVLMINLIKRLLFSEVKMVLMSL